MTSKSSDAIQMRVLALGLIVLIITPQACATFGTTTKVKITATVDVEGKLYSGSAVQAYHCRKGGGIFGSLDVGGCEVKGEAVVVDLKSRGYLFLILPSQSYVAYSLLHAKDKRWWKRQWQLSPSEMLRAVTFEHLQNPLSVKDVDPSHLENTFGKGAKLKSVTVAYSMAGITRGTVDKLLPWLNVAEGRSSFADRLSKGSGVARTIYVRDFRRLRSID